MGWHLRPLSSGELSDWAAVWALRAEEAEEAQRRAKASQEW